MNNLNNLREVISTNEERLHKLNTISGEMKYTTTNVEKYDIFKDYPYLGAVGDVNLSNTKKYYGIITPDQDVCLVYKIAKDQIGITEIILGENTNEDLFITNINFHTLMI